MSFTHSIMFHHFHSEKHHPAQGSLSAADFEAMLYWLSDRYTLLNADTYLHKFEAKKLEPTDICLSFDDALLCQFDVAVPILKSWNIKAFFFVYSSVFTGTPDLLEVFRYFRTTWFESVDEFYECFFEIVKSENSNLYLSEYKRFQGLDYLAAYPFYSNYDKWFRYFRDQVLGAVKYNNLMLDMMQQMSFDRESASRLLWMAEDNVIELHKDGHLVGLHSFSHPTQMSKLSRVEQEKQYAKNLEHLESLLGAGSVYSMSHPVGDYNDDTLELLAEMNIRIGFRSSLSRTDIRSALEVPRDDHSNVFREMKSENYSVQ